MNIGYVAQLEEKIASLKEDAEEREEEVAELQAENKILFGKLAVSDRNLGEARAELAVERAKNVKGGE